MEHIAFVISLYIINVGYIVFHIILISFSLLQLASYILILFLESIKVSQVPHVVI